jgi:hypothetical protein
MVHGVMAWLATRGARNVFVAIPEWQSRLARLGAWHVAGRREVTWVPIPSNMPDSVDPIRVRAIRQQLLETRRRTIVGHFGTFGRFHVALLAPTVERILDDGADRAMLLIGRNGALLRDTIVVRRPDLDARITVTGELAPQEVSAHLVACDVLLQPYDDGISARRSTAMAGMALGKAIVSNRGIATSCTKRSSPRLRSEKRSSAKGTFIIRRPYAVGTYCTSSRVSVGSARSAAPRTRSASVSKCEGSTCTVTPGNAGGAPTAGGHHTSTTSPDSASARTSWKV